MAHSEFLTTVNVDKLKITHGDLSVSAFPEVEVSNQGRFVVLEVDGSKSLVLGMESMEEEEALSGALRLALGGILINNNKMIVQVGQF